MTTREDVPSTANKLLSKLQTKLVVLPSVINTQQLHRHYTSQNTTANRLLQRLAIPEQLTARYKAGVLQPEAERWQYKRFQRTESVAGGEPLTNISLVQRLPESGWQEQGTRELEKSSSPNISASSPIINHAHAATPQETYRISRHTNLSNSVNAIAEGSFPIADSTTTQTREQSSLLRVTRIESNATAISSTSTTSTSDIPIHRKYPRSELLWRDDSDGVISEANSSHTVTPTYHSAVAQTNNSLTPQTGVTLQRKYHQSQLQVRRSQDATGVLPTAHLQANSDVIRMALSTQATTDLVDNRSNFLIQRSDLPLAISPNQNNLLVSRQTTDAGASVPSETISAIPTPTAPTTSSATNTDVDLGEIAEQVSRIILRRLVVERERGGMGR
ncbi:hypothetical protein [Anabaena azotica]|uniref:Uncharacterized protein n=1 Tax=Anabaena azotica FACHB-119 TaxID=947527 RepID=A0ABR8D9D5_9NOST|nr:hypothetical protein [Anabaena azotica]MBD2503807.1 hypothetical protein [Anabaena azotica FACHB-119]